MGPCRQGDSLKSAVCLVYAAGTAVYRSPPEPVVAVAKIKITGNAGIVRQADASGIIRFESIVE
jgi:hypothetical protein